MDQTTMTAAVGTAAQRGQRPPAGTGGTTQRVILHLPDLTPRPGRKAASPTTQGAAHPATPGKAAKPSTAATTTIHAAHTAEQRVRPPTVAIAAPVAAPQPTAAKRRILKPQPMLLLALIGITFGVLVGAIITRDRQPPLAPMEPPPAWDGDAAHHPTAPVDGVSESRTADPHSSRTASNPPDASGPADASPQSQSADDSASQVPGVARLNGRIEVEPPVDNHEQPRPGLY